MREKLKPCPFCGDKAILRNRAASFYTDDRYYVAKCISCGAMIGESSNEQEVIKAWNRRDGNAKNQ